MQVGYSFSLKHIMSTSQGVTCKITNTEPTIFSSSDLFGQDVYCKMLPRVQDDTITESSAFDESLIW